MSGTVMCIHEDRVVERIHAETLKASPSARSEVSLVASKGCLREVPIPELIHALRKDRHNGVLLVEHGRKKKAVEFKDGCPVLVKSNLLSECFGNHLVREGIVDEILMDESVKRMRAGEGLQGEILVAMDVLEEETLVAALRSHALEKFFEIFTWLDGGYEVRARAHVQRGSSLGIEGHPARLVVEGVRRAFPLEQIDRLIAAHENAYLVPLEGGETGVEDAHPTPREREWIAGLAVSTTLGALVDAPEWLRRFVFGLISIGVLGLDEHEGVSTAEAPSCYAEELSRSALEEAVEDEGSRALLAETEFQKGEALLADRDYEGALLCFGRAMQNFPSEGEYRSHYGWALYLCHQDDDVMLGEALEHCREGVKLAKDREKPYLLLGWLYRAMGKVGAAKKMFSRAVQIKPQCVEAMRELRIMNMRRGKDAVLGTGVLKKLFRR